MKRLLAVVLSVPALIIGGLYGTANASSDNFGTISENTTGGAPTEVLDLSSCSFGWTDSSQAVTTFIYRDTFGRDLARVVNRVQWHFPVCGDTNLLHVDAARAACSIRNLNSTLISGVKVTQCAFGMGNRPGPALTVSGTALDGGTCCANAVTPFRYAHYDSDTDNISFRARCTCAFRGRASGNLYTYNSLASASGPNWVLG